MKKIQPPFLRRGDEVAIVSPSWSIDEEKINYAVVFLENWGLKVRTGKNVLKRQVLLPEMMMSVFLIFRK